MSEFWKHKQILGARAEGKRGKGRPFDRMGRLHGINHEKKK
jgi:hypothetical protein